MTETNKTNSSSEIISSGKQANELKTNLEKGTKKASIPVAASFAKQCTAAVEIIESGNIFQKEMEKNNDSRKT